MLNDDIWLSKVSFEFTQSGNSDGTTNEYEELTVDIMSSGNIQVDEYYMVLRTNTGWSINTPDEFLHLLKEVDEKIKEK